MLFDFISFSSERVAISYLGQAAASGVPSLRKWFSSSSLSALQKPICHVLVHYTTPFKLENVIPHLPFAKAYSAAHNKSSLSSKYRPFI